MFKMDSGFVMAWSAFAKSSRLLALYTEIYFGNFIVKDIAAFRRASMIIGNIFFCVWSCSSNCSTEATQRFEHFKKGKVSISQFVFLSPILAYRDTRDCILPMCRLCWKTWLQPLMYKSLQCRICKTLPWLSWFTKNQNHYVPAKTFYSLACNSSKSQ